VTAAPTPSRGLEGDALAPDAIAERIRARFGDVEAEVVRGELTVHVGPGILVDVLTFCRDDHELDCALLADLSGVHWPAGEHVIERQPATTGWPDYRASRDDGVVEVLYVLRSVSHNHWLRVATATPDTDPRLPSVTGIFETANFHEREVYDFFGVEFDGHPGLTRILMPDDWVGHPHRKDYPLGGVDIPYQHEKFIPPPDERSIRESIR
jgi:NADH-quinone oxidoreductase subunit C